MGALIRLLLVVLVIGLIWAYMSGNLQTYMNRGTTQQDIESIKQRAAEVGKDVQAKVAVAAEKLDESMGDGTLTTKIKSKMALDDFVDANTINVDTVDGVVTLTGSVKNEQARTRAVQLAKETNGVKRVDDRLQIAPR